MWKKLFIASLLIAGVAFTGGYLRAADFDLTQPAIEMRRLQKCESCGELLVVTTLAEGAAVRCPKCQQVQRRLPNRELLVKVYQICPSCSARLDVAGLPVDSPLRCGVCGFAQRVMAEAVMPPSSGTGEIPAGATIYPSATEIPTPPQRSIPDARVPGLNADSLADQDTGIFVDQRNSTGTNPERLAAASTRAPAENIYPASITLTQLAADLKISARVNGEPVSTAAVNQTVLRNLQLLQLRRGALPTAEELTDLRQTITAQLIERELLRQAAEHEGYVPNDRDIQARLDLAPNSQTHGGVQAEMIWEEMKKRHSGQVKLITEKEIGNYFTEHRDDFATPVYAQLRAITIFRSREGRGDHRSAETIAREVQERLNFGISFAAVATRYSEDVFRNDGGLLRGNVNDGLVALADLDPHFTSQLTNPLLGKIYGPIDLPTLIAFCQIEKITAPKLATLAEVKPQIRERLQQLARDEAFAEWLAKLKKSALIEYQ